MNLAETIALVEALKLAGVTKFKSAELDISFEAPTKHKKKASPSAPEEKPSEESPLLNTEATEKLKDLISTLKMSDEELANQIFPDGAL